MTGTEESSSFELNSTRRFFFFEGETTAYCFPLADSLILVRGRQFVSLVLRVPLVAVPIVLDRLEWFHCRVSL